MRNRIKRKFLVAGVFLFSIFLKLTTIYADEVKFDTAKADEVVKTNILTPASAWIAGIAVGVAILVGLISFIIWLLKSEEEREQKPYTKILKPILIGLAVAESLAAILAIVSLK